jgi:DNA-binding MarR family transcriptional regulator
MGQDVFESIRSPTGGGPQLPAQDRQDLDDVIQHVPDILFDTSANIRLRAPTEAGLAELAPSELEVLRLVSMHPGCGILFLTEHTKMRQANASTTVRSLVEQGLMRKQVDPRDRRAVQLSPTPQASADLQALREVWNKRIKNALTAASITEAEYHEFARVLAALHRGLAATADEPLPLAPDAFDQAPPLPRGAG